MRKSTRPGFSLLDVIILFAILVVGTAILLPTVQRNREQALQKQTANNLRQCAIAVHNYHAVFNKLPNAAWTGGIYINDDAQRSMWFQLLVFVEEDVAYKENRHDAVAAAYLSPEDKSLVAKKGRLCFAANIRIFGYQTLTAAEANGAVDKTKGTPTGNNLSKKLEAKMKSGLTLARIPDGTSNVFMLATRAAECGSPAQSTLYSGSPTGTMLTKGGGALVAGAALVPSVGAPKDGKGKGGFFGAGSHNKAAGASVDAIFQPATTAEKCLADDSVFGHAFSEKGLYVALCDASVKLTLPTMTPTIFCRALCPSDGFPLDNDWND